MKPLILFCSIVLLFACRKPDFHPHDPASGYRIKSMQSNDVTMWFEYDSIGNLISRKRSDWSFLALAFNYYFEYDSLGRLSDLIIPGFGPDDTPEKDKAFQFWHRYKYDNRNRIIYDSVYAGGYIGMVNNRYVPIPGLYGYTEISEVRYTYDFRNRIISTAKRYLSPTYNYVSDYKHEEFIYDNKNLLKKTEITYRQDGSAGSYTYDFLSYDNKINLNRTNPVLQFLNEDYSINNPTSMALDNYPQQWQLAYNSANLPVSYGVAHGDFYYTYFTDVLIAAPYTVTYESY